MTAKEFLRQIKKLDVMITNKLTERTQWLEIARGLGGMQLGEKVQSSGSQQKMADAVDRYIDLEREIDACIDRLIDTKMDVISVIEQLNAVEYDVLHKIYVQGKELWDVADSCNRTYSWVTTIHGRGLKNVQRILDERESNA